MTCTIAPHRLAELLASGGEVAFIDVREIVPHGSGHPLLARHLPGSRLELLAGRLIPRRNTPVVVLAGDDAGARAAAGRLGALDYTDVAVLEGGTQAWAAAGFALFPELEVVSKGFGAFAARHGSPRFIAPDALARALGSGEDWVVLDSRPEREYRAGNIPGSVDAPGADAVRCFDDLVPDPDTKVVVNCMTRTRGILGGLGLVAAGVPNEVYVLENGTRNWLLEGFELERGASRIAGPPSPAAAAAAVARVRALVERAGLPVLARDALAGLCADGARTTYLIDVRGSDEYAAGHLPGALSAPSGTVVMSPDEYFATRGARIVLVDDDGVRAGLTAVWLAQMGWGEVAVHAMGHGGGDLETGPDRVGWIDPPAATLVEPEALAGALARGEVEVLDVGRSDPYVEGHVPGASWCPRERLGGWTDERAESNPSREVVLTSGSGLAARLAAGDIADRLAGVRVLAGGNAAWAAAGHPLAKGDDDMVGARDDHWLASSERPGDVRANVVDYIDWEIGLLDDIERGGPSPYRNLLWGARR